MRNLAVLVTLITILHSALSLNGVIQFFPTWTNCDNTSAIQFFDFYLDHKPSLKPNTLLGPSAITPNNFTLVTKYLKYSNLKPSVLTKELMTPLESLTPSIDWITRPWFPTLMTLIIQGNRSLKACIAIAFKLTCRLCLFLDTMI